MVKRLKMPASEFMYVSSFSAYVPCSILMPKNQAAAVPGIIEDGGVYDGKSGVSGGCGGRGSESGGCAGGGGRGGQENGGGSGGGRLPLGLSSTGLRTQERLGWVSSQ